MNISIGGNSFNNVSVPVLWGQRAIIQHNDGQLSVIDLSGKDAKAEVIAGSPSAGIEFKRDDALITILQSGEPSFQLDTSSQTISDLSGRLPPCTIGESAIYVGTNQFSHNMVSGSAVGLIVTEDGFGMGAPLPEGLAKLVLEETMSAYSVPSYHVRAIVAAVEEQDVNTVVWIRGERERDGVQPIAVSFQRFGEHVNATALENVAHLKQGDLVEVEYTQIGGGAATINLGRSITKHEASRETSGVDSV